MEKIMTTETQILTQGVHHIGLTVNDLLKTSKFFTEVLGFKKVGEKPDYPAHIVSDGQIVISLWQVCNPAKAVNFDRKSNIGLHHFAIKLADVEILEELYQKLKETEGVGIEFSPEQLGNGSSQHMMIIEPGGIRIEFIVPTK